MADISFRQAQKLVDFELVSGNNIARKMRWGRDLVSHERKIEGEEHKQLRAISVNHLRRYGYNINMMPVGVKGIYAISDYFAEKNGVFFFVECLTKKTIEMKPEILFKKLQLSAYAPMWLIVPRSVDFNMIPVGHAHILFVDFDKKELITEFKGSFNSYKRRKIKKKGGMMSKILGKKDYHKKMEKIVKAHPHAYQKWTNEEEKLLLKLFKKKFTIQKISGLLERQPGGIRARLIKLGKITEE